MADRKEAFLQMQKDAKKALELAQQSFDEMKTRSDQLTVELDNLRSMAKLGSERECSQIIEEAKVLAAAIKSETARVQESLLNEAKVSLEQEISTIVKQKVEEILVEKLKNQALQEKVIKLRINALESLNLN